MKYPPHRTVRINPAYVVWCGIQIDQPSPYLARAWNSAKARLADPQEVALDETVRQCCAAVVLSVEEQAIRLCGGFND